MSKYWRLSLTLSPSTSNIQAAGVLWRLREGGSVPPGPSKGPRLCPFPRHLDGALVFGGAAVALLGVASWQAHGCQRNLMWIVVLLTLVALISGFVVVVRRDRQPRRTTALESPRMRLLARISAWSISVAATLAVVVTSVLIIDEGAYDLIPVIVLAIVATAWAWWYASQT